MTRIDFAMGNANPKTWHNASGKLSDPLDEIQWTKSLDRSKSRIFYMNMLSLKYQRPRSETVKLKTVKLTRLQSCM